MNRNRKDPASGLMAALILVLFALSGIALYMSSINQQQTENYTSPTVTRPAQSTTTTTTTTAPPEEIILLTAECAADMGDARVQASAAVSAPGQIISLTCSLTDDSGEVVYLETVPAAEGRWEICGHTGSGTVRVEAITATGKTEVWQQDVTFTAPEFIWPVEPEYQMLLHDRYQVSSGSNTVGGYTHNNGLMREKHYVFGSRRNHYGFDITAAPGSSVSASADGTVLGIYTDTDDIGSTGYGRYIIIRHKNKHNDSTVFTLYAHLSGVMVNSGDDVVQGQTVALTGNTGGSRIPHLHLEFRLGTNDNKHAVDPLELLPQRDFSLRRSALEPEKGFAASSVGLYADMLDGGWDYAIPGCLRNPATFNGNDVPIGTRVEIVYRKGDTVTFTFGGASYSCSASELEYTFD